MRLTILINGPDPTVNHDYAVLWLDTKERVWSRESHEGIELPPWGEVRDEGGVTKLCGHQTETPVCTLSGLHVDRYERVAAAQGAAEWACASQHSPVGGVWRLQAVEKKSIEPENSVFPH
ncbi:DUF3564 domain-containing protein [Trinickia sp. LjRoot230]|uniref:DUF3564 family protein n=1 Tax=Trinickia sp. LjRoot230 TaxID=3342288 RepID=UPI003ECE7B76